MTKELVRVVTDTGTSIRPEDPQATALNVTVLPLDVIFSEGGKDISYPDTHFSPEEFYQKMARSPELPTTSGAIVGIAYQAYLELAETTDQIISIHLTSEHSVAFLSALDAADEAAKKIPELTIEVIDSRNLSLGAWFLVEQAAQLANQGLPLEEIKEQTLATIPQIELLALLPTLENLVKSGRVPAVAGIAAQILRIIPIIGISGTEGRVDIVEKVRTIKKAEEKIVKRAEKAGELVRLGVIHSNVPQAAAEMKSRLKQIFPQGEILVQEAGPVLGVHAGEGAVGIAFQKK